MSFDDKIPANNDIVMVADGLGKCYHIYDHPFDRLKQMVFRERMHHREFWALRDVSFEIRQGETVGLIGRNGSGKSTLLQMICGTLTPTVGCLETRGRIAALLELGAGFNPEFSGYDNIIFNAAVMGLSQAEILASMDAIIDFSELAAFIQQPVKTYSSGMYVRLAFAIAVHVTPQIMIVDEALAVGDARFQAKCMRRIKDMQTEGVTILFVSHDVSAVRTLCNRVFWLEQGCLHQQGDVFPVTGAYIERLFADESAFKPEQPCCHEPVIIGGHETSSTSPQPSLSQPTAHWGSHPGCILSAGVYASNQPQHRQDRFDWDQSIEVRICVQLPEDIVREHLSVAFSIKDLKGSDLIVSTTHDFGETDYSQGTQFSVSFQFTNVLVEGQYLLVAALENRYYKDIHYYEYIEGVHYFSVTSSHRFFGLAQPKIRQAVQAFI